MGNVSRKFRWSRKATIAINSSLQTPEARGFLNEIGKDASYEENLSKLSRAIHYMKDTDDFESPDTLKLLSHIALYTGSKKSISSQYRLDWINQLCEHEAMEFFVSTWKRLFSRKLFLPKYEGLAKFFRVMTRIMCDCTEISTRACDILCNCDLVKTIVDSISSRDLTGEMIFSDQMNANRLYIAHYALCILRNILSLCPTAKHDFRSANGLDACKTFFTCEVDIIKCEALLCLAYAMNEHENYVILGGERMVHLSYLIKLLRGSTVEKDRSRLICPIVHLIKALNRIAANDSNKERLGNLGLLTVYSSILGKSRDEDDIINAIEGVWTLAFNGRNRERIMTNKQILASLIASLKCENRHIASKAEGAIWIVDNRLEREFKRYTGSKKRCNTDSENVCSEGGSDLCKSVPAVPAPSVSSYISSPRRGMGMTVDEGNKDSLCRKYDVVISYEMTFEKAAADLHQHLQRLDLNVWIDLDSSTTLDSRTEAIENSKIVLIFISDSYKVSPMCRSELEYASLLRRTIVPVLVESNYEPEGWLGIQIGKKPIFDISNEDSKNRNLPKLENVLREHIVLRMESKPFLASKSFPASRTYFPSVEETRMRLMPKSQTMDAVRGTREWTCDDVQKWLCKMGLKEAQHCMMEFDGAALVALQNMLSRAPGVYYHNMKHEIGLDDMLLLLRFTNALEMLHCKEKRCVRQTFLT